MNREKPVVIVSVLACRKSFAEDAGATMLVNGISRDSEGVESGPVAQVALAYSGDVGVRTTVERRDLFLSAIHY